MNEFNGVADTMLPDDGAGPETAEERSSCI